jgi:WD40 repeat protein
VHVVGPKGGTIVLKASLAGKGEAAVELTPQRTAVFDVTVSTHGLRGAYSLRIALAPFEGPFVLHAPAAIVGMDLTPDGRRLVTGGSDKAIHVWDLGKRQGRAHAHGHQEEIWAVAVSRDGKRVLAGGEEGQLRYSDLDTDRTLWVSDAGAKIRCIGWLPDVRQAITGGYDSILRLWDLDACRELRRFEGHQDMVMSLAIAPDGSRLISGSGSRDRTVRLWNIAAGAEIQRFVGHNDHVLALAFVDQRHIVSGSADGAVRLWDITTGRTVRSFYGHTGAVNALAVSRDGKSLLTGGADDKVRLWDISTGVNMHEYPGHEGGTYAVRFAPDGRHVITAGTDGLIRASQLPGH